MSDLQVVATIPAKPEAADASARPCQRSSRRRSRGGGVPVLRPLRVGQHARHLRDRRAVDRPGGPRRPHGARRTWRPPSPPPTARSAARSRSTRCSRWTERAGLREPQGPARRAAAQQHGRRDDQQQRRADRATARARTPPTIIGSPIAPRTRWRGTLLLANIVSGWLTPGVRRRERVGCRTTKAGRSAVSSRHAQVPTTRPRTACGCGDQPRPTRPLLPAAQQTFATQSTTW